MQLPKGLSNPRDMVGNISSKTRQSKSLEDFFKQRSIEQGTQHLSQMGISRLNKSFIEEKRPEINRQARNTADWFSDEVKNEVGGAINELLNLQRKEVDSPFKPFSDDRPVPIDIREGLGSIQERVQERRKPVEWRPPFAIDKKEVELGVVERGAVDFMSRIIELPARALMMGSADVGNFIASGIGDRLGYGDFMELLTEKNKEVDTPIDGRRIGFEEPTVRTAAGDMYNLMDEGFAPLEAGLMTFGTRTLDVAVGASIFNSMAAVTRDALKGAPLGAKKVEYWKELGAPKNAAQAKTNYRKYAHQFHPDKAAGGSDSFRYYTEARDFLSKHGMPTRADMVKHEAWRSLEPFTKQSVVTSILKKPPVIKSPKGNYKINTRKWEEIWRDAANFPNRFLKYDGVKTGLQPHELANAENLLKLPGYRPIPGQGPNIGLSIEKWQKVGGTHKQIAEELLRKYPKDQAQNIIRYRGEKLLSDVGMFGIKNATDKVMLADVPNIVQPKISETYQKARDAIMSEQLTPVFPERTTNLHELTPSLFKVADDSRLNKLHQLIKKTREGKQKDALLKRQAEEAKKSGIAIIKDSEGRDVPAIRDSGFFASEELTRFPIKDGGTEFTSPLNQALEQDSSFAIQEGMFGPSARTHYFPFKEADATKQRAIMEDESYILDTSKRTKTPINKKTGEEMYTVWENVHRDDFANLSVSQIKNKYPKIQKYEDNVISAAQSLVKQQDKLRETANEIRRRMGLPEIGKVDFYGPRVQEMLQYQKVQNDPQFDPGDVYDFIVPNYTLNKFAKPRVKNPPEKELNKNAWELQEFYINSMNNEIYMNPIIEQMKANMKVWEQQGKGEAVEYWNKIIKTNITRRPGSIDETFGLKEGTVAKKGLDKIIDARIKSNLIGNIAWNLTTQPLSYMSLTAKEAGLANTFMKGPAKYMFDKDSAMEAARDHTLALKEKRGHSAAYQGGLDAYDKTIFTSPIRNLSDLMALPAHVMEKNLTGMSYVATKEQGKAYGFTGDDLIHFASMGAEHTQSLYNRALRAPVLNNTAVRAGFPHQTFSIEQWRHMKQIFGKGKMPADARVRLGMATNLIGGICIMNLFFRAARGYTFTTPGDFIPFVGSNVDALIDQMIDTDISYGKRDTVALTEDAFELARAVNDINKAHQEITAHDYDSVGDIARATIDYAKDGNLDNLIRTAVYWTSGLVGPGGGQQINRIVDFAVDMNKGYTEDMYGREWFPVELRDIPSGLLFGKHTTPSAKEAQEEMERLDQYVERRNEMREDINRRAERLDKKFGEMNPEEADMQLRELKLYEPELAKRVEQIATQTELTATEARFNSLGVEDWTRAIAIKDFYKDKPIQEQAKIFDELRAKGVITPKVQLQLDNLLDW